MNNLNLYEKGRTVPAEAKKNISAGRLKGMTDINPMFRIKRLTEMFGPCGLGWWYEVIDKRIVFDELSNQKSAFVDIKLYYIDPESEIVSHGIPGTGGASFVAQEKNGPYMSDECFKMALTDAISVASKAIGIGADVYWDKDCSKYSGTPESESVKCEACGAVIVPYPGNDGKTVSVNKHATASKRQFGRVLCLTCIRDLAAE